MSDTEQCPHGTRCFTIAALRCMAGVATAPPGSYFQPTQESPGPGKPTYKEILAVAEGSPLPEPEQCIGQVACYRLTGPIDPPIETVAG